jgi:hypothetical protein
MLANVKNDYENIEKNVKEVVLKHSPEGVLNPFGA